jgi:hypothetical integral membrane protein (TIGR02206 family)
VAFVPYSMTHGLAVLAGLVLVSALVLAGSFGRASSDGARDRVFWGWLWFVVVVQVTAQVSGNLPGRLSPAQTLPLHICDLAPWIGVWALLSRARWALSLAYFWGFGLSIWAFVMPVLGADAWSLDFWLFWVGHSQIIGTAAYLIAVQGFRPTWADFRTAVVATITYACVMVPTDLWLNADYGYVGRRSPTAELGPWPMRIPVLLLLETGLFAGLMLPWRFGRSEGPARLSS